MRIGVLGGTFDPPHYGHLILAEQARDQLALDSVLWVPAADPPHKQGVAITPVEARLAMLRLALTGNPAFAISRADIDRPGPHYSVDMLRLLLEQHPESELFFLLGEDSLRDLPTWHQPAQLAQLATLVVMRRPGLEYDLSVIERSVPGLQQRLCFLEMPYVNISGLDIRQRLRANRSVRYLLPDSVIGYIHLHKLYRPLAAGEREC